MVKKAIRKPPARKAIRHPREPELPFYFKQVEEFLKEVEVSAALQPDLVKARKAMVEILKTIYGFDASQICWGEAPRFWPV